MKDEQRKCTNCGHEHAYGTLRYSPDLVPLKGPRKCWCNCVNFIEVNEDVENLPTMAGREVQELWSQTSYLNAQVPMATRIAVRQITDLLKSDDPNALLTKALPEFAGLMISQITDIRGAMTREEGKFAHLVAHTDEIVEAMRGVVQLSERLSGILGAIRQIQKQQAKTERDIAGIAAVLKTLAPKAVEIQEVNEDHNIPLPEDDSFAAFAEQFFSGQRGSEVKSTEAIITSTDGIEARRVFIEKTAPLTNEPIVIDLDSTDD
jgi:hypothetical protein